ncbi:MAG: repressor LexA [Clostridia bacterium]|nr:repressor LexA [Clostridia bacterium]
MRVKKPEIMEHIITFVNEFRREYGRSPSTSEIGTEVGVAKGTAYTYLTRMNELGMIRYDGKDIITNLSDRINKEVNSTPIIGRVVCGDPVQEEEMVEEYVDLPASVFGYGELFILEAYGDSMDRAGIDAGDYVVVRKQNTASSGDLVVALTNGENNLKRIQFDNDRQVIALCPESSNKRHKVKEYKEVQIQGVATHVIKKLT